MKPGDFLFGVLDVFAVLLPGALATWLVLQYAPGHQLRTALTLSAGAGSEHLQPWATGLAFVLASYVLGHFVFMFGSFLDVGYGRVLGRIRGTDLAFKQADALRLRDFPEPQPRVDAAAVPPAHVPAATGKPVPTTLQWARAYVTLHAPASRVEIDRLEADSKFFRSMVVIAVGAAAHFIEQDNAIALIACIVLLVLSALRYMERRWKMTQLAYVIAVLIARTQTPGPARAYAAPVSDD